ncbi:hypothetical protein LGZ99_07260 [Photorhabdus temperata]|uniref:Uncharacterized protein n=1 Tax=Photorhabdus temperata J3 TaxID=1389415 RepID=U7QZG9_PHOTE|nr:hypothetical protein [Photorhabdus temperata]EQB98892.1 hypothetical protein B738_21835 [Photorhabdus temperata subsp. temperata M1021]ERT12445.1 hypothetical protein O185_14220 [Photorhabdus temperata J3]MCT8347017.1 hypothetical protein [Photorhabdus temperata]
MIKGTHYIFVILSAISFQAFALNFHYKSDIPADNKPSAEYMKQRENLESNHLNVDKLAADNELVKKREQEKRGQEKQDEEAKRYAERWQNNELMKKWEQERRAEEIERRAEYWQDQAEETKRYAESWQNNERFNYGVNRGFNHEFHDPVLRDMERAERLKRIEQNGGITRRNFFDKK